jgi:outer membrane protein assembly factor BamB
MTHRPLVRATLVAALLLGLVAAVAPGASAGAAAEDWPMFHHDPQHVGVSGETGISSSVASSLAIQWQASLGSVSYTSPAVVWNATLGKRLVYVGNQAGAMQAFDADTGNRIWWYKSGAAITSSVAVDGNVVYFGSNDHFLTALDATTGDPICRFNSGGVIASSPLVIDPAGTGKLVVFGDNGLTGTDDGGHEWAMHAVDPNPAADCSEAWSFTGFGQPPGSATLSGSWSPPAYGVTTGNIPLVVFGGSSPDNAVYALDARTGVRVWRFQTEVFQPDNDVGAGPTISPPGVNGFADGVVYISGKDGIIYALNLATGAKIWEYRLRDFYTSAGSPRSTASLVGARLFLGFGGGVTALNAVTGAKIWNSQDVNGRVAGIVSSPAVVGPGGDRILFAGDFDGVVRGYDLASGLQKWSYPTGALIYGSPAVSGGRIFITSSSGFLYAFGLGGGVSAKPVTTIVAPSDGATVPNPAGPQQVTGSVSDDTGVSRVLVSVKNTNTAKYWDAGSAAWVSIYTQNEATMTAPGGTASNWSLSFPAPPAGGVFQVQAESEDLDGQHDATVAQSVFSMTSLGAPPDTAITAPTNKKIFTFPGGIRQSFPITVDGTAVDAGGTLPGVRAVKVVILNIDHTEYFCGTPGCGGGESSSWTPVFTSVNATLASPNATSTTWTLTFPTYDHPHDYRITAWAIDRNGQADTTRAKVNRICVRDPGTNTCG